MKVEIEIQSNGYVVKYTEKDISNTYVYRSVDDLYMVEEIVKRFLKRRIKAVEQ